MAYLFEVKFTKRFPYIRITKEKLYCLLMQAIVIGILGFILETIVSYISMGELCDRGILCGPFIPMFSIFLVIILIFVKIPKLNLRNYLICFLIFAFGVTILEIIVGYTSEAILNHVLWDYRGLFPLSLKYVSVFSFLIWGILGALYFLVVVPFIYKMSLKINIRIRYYLVITFLSILLIDIIVTIGRIIYFGGYKELYNPTRSIELSIFLVGIIFYIITITLFGFLLIKPIKDKFPKAQVYFWLIYNIISYIPIFSVYDFLMRPNNSMIEGLSILGFLLTGFYLYLVLYKICFYLITVIVKICTRHKEDLSFSFKMSLLVIEGFLSLMTIFIGVISVKNPIVKTLNIGTGENELCIVALSDIHYDSTGSILDINKMVNMINKQNPDLVLMTGDIIDNRISEININKFSNSMSKINSTYGIYACAGNHEYGKNTYNEVINFFNKTPINLLVDQSVIIDNKIEIIGRQDISYTDNRKGLSEIIKRPDLPLIVLDHQPQNYKDALNNNASLQISGHTHNGQLFPANLLIKAQYAFIYNNATMNGLYHHDNFYCYVTKGYGHWGFPLRTTGRSELVKINYKY